MKKNNKAWYVSSQGRGISLTLKGVAVGFVPLIAGLAGLYGYNLPEEELFDFIDAGFQAVSYTMIALGILRKFVIKFKIRF